MPLSPSVDRRRRVRTPGFATRWSDVGRWSESADAGLCAVDQHRDGGDEDEIVSARGEQRSDMRDRAVSARSITARASSAPAAERKTEMSRVTWRGRAGSATSSAAAAPGSPCPSQRSKTIASASRVPRLNRASRRTAARPRSETRRSPAPAGARWPTRPRPSPRGRPALGRRRLWPSGAEQSGVGPEWRWAVGRRV